MSVFSTMFLESELAYYRFVGDPTRRPKSGVFLFTKFAQNKNKILRIFHQKKDFEFSLLVGSTSEDRQ